MPLSNQIGAYSDCLDLWTKAVTDPVGTRALFSTYPEAFKFQARLNHYRKLEREESKRVYERSDPKWNTSEFDPLIVRIKAAAEDDGWWVYIERHGADIITVESLSEVEAPADAP